MPSLQPLNHPPFSLPNPLTLFTINHIHLSQYLSPPLTTYHIHTSLLSHTPIHLLLQTLVHPTTFPKTLLIASHPL
ncbi:substrate-binding domain-containing protein, partial [Bacillus sp. WP8]|uniref:substrate-binding domain-containing protein n=1 Tax=Bacillus sp. WP8 TaxID=756828 RepID=UPI0037BECB3C